jgi:hypothetical protein
MLSKIANTWFLNVIVIVEEVIDKLLDRHQRLRPTVISVTSAKLDWNGAVTCNLSTNGNINVQSGKLVKQGLAFNYKFYYLLG